MTRLPYFETVGLLLDWTDHHQSLPTRSLLKDVVWADRIAECILLPDPQMIGYAPRASVFDPGFSRLGQDSDAFRSFVSSSEGQFYAGLDQCMTQIIWKSLLLLCNPNSKCYPSSRPNRYISVRTFLLGHPDISNDTLSRCCRNISFENELVYKAAHLLSTFLTSYTSIAEIFISRCS